MTTNHSKLPAEPALSEKVAAALERLHVLKIQPGDLLVLPVDMDEDEVERMVAIATSLRKAIEKAMGLVVPILVLPGTEQLRSYSREEGVAYLERCLAELRG